MNASQQQLQRLIQLYRLRDLYILKDNIGLEFNHMHYNKPARKIDHVFNKALKEEIANVVDGTGSNVKTVKELKNIIPEALKQQQKTLVKNPDRFIKHAVKSNSKDYGKILQNRVKKETHNLTAKIEQERIKTTYEGLLDNKLKKELYRNLKGKVAARPKNIVKDALHTNQSNIGFIKALNEGYLYKEWMNGRKIMMRGGTKKSRTRPWHRASIIDTVPVDEYFDIYGSYHAQLMYPGDLNGGAENVANCRCWSRYTNTKPTGMKSKGNGGIKRIIGNGTAQSFTDLWKQKLTAKSNGSSKRSKNNSKLKELRVNNDNYDRTKVYFEEKPKNNKTSKKDKQSITTKIKNKITSLTSKTKNILKKPISKLRNKNKSSNIARQVENGSPYDNIKSKNPEEVKKKLRKELPEVFSDKAIDTIAKEWEKRFGADKEYGQVFSYVTGELKGETLIGNATSVEIIMPDTFERNLAALHNHTKIAFHAPSGEDFRVGMSNYNCDFFIALSQKEIWAIEALGRYSFEKIMEVELNINRNLMNIKEDVKNDISIPDNEKVRVMNERAGEYIKNYINNINQSKIKVYQVIL